MNIGQKQINQIPCRIYRGGTSRGVFFLADDLPSSQKEQEKILLRVLGSPDRRQIDGVGGANSQTSKAMILSRPTDSETGVDVAMCFAQVGIERPVVDWSGNCGNLTSAAGLFAVNSGLLQKHDPVTVVRIVRRNTGVRVDVHIPTNGNSVVMGGDYSIPGVPGTSARIDCDWHEPSGSAGHGLLPTGNSRDVLTTENGREYEVSIVDAANPVVFVNAAAVGLVGTELPGEIESRSGLVDLLDQLRKIGASCAGIPFSPGIPKLVVVSRASDYKTSGGLFEPESTHDIQARMIAMRTVHRSYAVTAAICTAVAGRISDTIVPRLESSVTRIAHPYGVMDVGVKYDGTRLATARVGRTARLVMTGMASLS